MKLIYKLSITIFSLFILVALFFCCKKNVSKCESIKIQLLLEDIFKKNYLYPEPNGSFQDDSSSYFVYLYTTNIIIPEKEFYLHLNSLAKSTSLDSIKLRKISNNFIKKKYTYQVSMSLIEVNEDTTKLKVAVGYSTTHNIAIDEATFSYSFDTINCKWIVLDSNLVKY
jgi:hypothetical protein